ncbi:MAG: hypothetical protein ACI9ON_001627 [Limisphaerales bacterium]|jgi:hypothetical protein
MFADLSQFIATSEIRELVIGWLMNVPGLPPILQSIHILSVAVIVASAGFIQLRMLGVGFGSQQIDEMFKRLIPWFGAALATALLTGMPFVIARPDRYFYNPIAGWKLVFLTTGLFITVVLFLQNRHRPGYWQRNAVNLYIGRAFSVIALCAWTGTIFAGRWIAYVDYLYWE